jgi:hypothetical protein
MATRPYLNAAPRWIEILIGVVLLVGAFVLIRFSVLGQPRVVLGLTDSSSSVTVRVATSLLALMASLTSVRLLRGRSSYSAALLPAAGLYAGAVIFATGAVVSFVRVFAGDLWQLRQAGAATVMAIAAWTLARRRSMKKEASPRS